VAPSASLARSALLSRGRVAFFPREALIAVLALNHPSLAARYVEDLAGLDFAGRDMPRLMGLILDRLSDPAVGTAQIASAIDGEGLGALRRQIEESAACAGPWPVRPEAAETDAEEVLRQALALHRRARALHRELKSAEIALAEAATEANLNRLREIQAELSGIEGREAAVEGYGISSGRERAGL
jgi:DNA primase